MAGFIVVGQKVEDPLKGLVADRRINITGKAIMPCLYRGVDGVDNLMGDSFCGGQNIVVRDGFREGFAKGVLEFLKN